MFVKGWNTVLNAFPIVLIFFLFLGPPSAFIYLLHKKKKEKVFCCIQKKEHIMIVVLLTNSGNVHIPCPQCGQYNTILQENVPTHHTIDCPRCAHAFENPVGQVRQVTWCAEAHLRADGHHIQYRDAGGERSYVRRRVRGI